MATFLHDDVCEGIYNSIIHLPITTDEWKWLGLLDNSGNEVTGGSYARIDVSSTWEWDTVNIRNHNNVDIDFTLMPAVTVKSWRLYSASSGGIAYVGNDFTSPTSVTVGSTFTVPAETLHFSLVLGSGLGITDAYKRTIIDYLTQGGTATTSAGAAAFWIDENGTGMSGDPWYLHEGNIVTTHFDEMSTSIDFCNPAWGAFNTSTNTGTNTIPWYDYMISTSANTIDYYAFGYTPPLPSAAYVKFKITLTSPVTQTADNLLVCDAGDSSITVEGYTGSQHVKALINASFSVYALTPPIVEVDAPAAVQTVNGSAAPSEFYEPLQYSSVEIPLTISHSDFDMDPGHPTYPITGKVFLDLDYDGIDEGDSGIAGITLSLMDGLTEIDTTVTDVSGNYEFQAVAGSYTVVVNPGAYVSTTVEEVAVSLPPSDTANFGLIQTGTVTVHAWDDIDGDGVIDGGETAFTVGSVVVGIYDGVTLVDFDTIGVSGEVTLSNIPPGPYTVRILSVPMGYEATSGNRSITLEPEENENVNVGVRLDLGEPVRPSLSGWGFIPLQ